MVSGLSNGLADVALYAMQQKQNETNAAVGVKVLKEALQTEEAIMNELLKSMGVGNNVNLLA